MKKISLSLLALLIVSVSFAQTKKIILQPNQELKVTVKMKQSSSVMGMGKMTSTSTITSLMKVEALTDSGYDLTMKIKRVVMDLDMMGTSKTLDSDNESSIDDEESSSLKKVLKEQKSYSLNAYTGTLEEKENTKPPVDTDMSSGEAGITGSMLEMQSANHKAIFMILPEKVLVGAMWTDSSNSENNAVKNTYKVTDIKDNVVTVAIAGTQKGEGEMEMMGMSMSTKIDNKNTGEAFINKKTGITESLKMSIIGSNEVAVMGQNMIVGSNITTETTVEM